MRTNESAGKHLLRDSNIQPTSDVLAEALGEQYAAYTQFLAMLSSFDVTPQWRYYHDGKAWLMKGLYKWRTVRGTDKEKTIFWLSIWDGFFRVNFYFAEKARNGLCDLAISEKTKRMIEDAKQMGKLKFIPIVFDLCSGERFSDLGVLINYQKSIK